MDKKIHIDKVVDAYNMFAEPCGFSKTSRHGLSRRLANAACDFHAGCEYVSERQLQALFVTSYKGTRGCKNRQIILFCDMADALLLETSFFTIAAAIEQVKSKELDIMAARAKRAVNDLIKRALIDRALKAAETEQAKPKSDKDRIEVARDMINALEDKSMLMNLFAKEDEESEAVG